MRIITLILVIFLISGVFWFFNNGMPTRTQQMSVTDKEDAVSPSSSNNQNQIINDQKASADQPGSDAGLTSFHTTEHDPQSATLSPNEKFSQTTADISQVSRGPSIEDPGTDIYGGGPEANADTDVILIAPEDSAP